MREIGPHVAHWVTRLWQTRPADLEGTAAIEQGCRTISASSSR